jgi:hypothetical protein
VTANATALEDWLDVAVELDAGYLLGEAQSDIASSRPPLLRLVMPLISE